MREIADNPYTFLTLSREPGFPERAAILMRSASRRDEAKVAESFPPGLAAGRDCTAAPLFGADVCRFVFTPHPEPTEGAFCGIRILLQDREGSRWSVGSRARPT